MTLGLRVVGIAIAIGFIACVTAEAQNRHHAPWIIPVGQAGVDKFYPPEAQRRYVEGRVELCCIMTPNRTASCWVAGEGPVGMGFGAAAINLSKQFRPGPGASQMSPKSPAQSVWISFKLGRPWWKFWDDPKDKTPVPVTSTKKCVSPLVS